MTLWITDRLLPLWQLLGVNYAQMRAILAVKLSLDNRRPVPAFTNWRQKEGQNTNGYWKSLALYAFLGLFTAIPLAFVSPGAVLMPAVLFFGYVMAICAMTLITDFSAVVLDSTDNQILLFRPVDGRTILAARITHIASYLLTFALAVSVVGILIISSRFGPIAGLLTLLLVLLVAILSLFLTNVFYLLLMRFMSEERLRETINYFQIVLGVLFYGSFQLMPRFFNNADPLNPTLLTGQWWMLLLPPFWCAGSLDLLINQTADTWHWLGLVLILTVPFAGLWLMSRVLGPLFGNRMATLDLAERQPTAPQPTATNVPGSLAKPSLADRLAGWLTTSPLERATFTMIWHLTSRDRKFKLKTYPSLAFGIVYVVMMSSRQSGMASFSQSHLFILYLSSLYMLGAIMQITVSDSYKAAWIYATTPISRPGELLAGGLKAVIVKLMLPYFALLAAYVFYRKGIDVLPDVLLALTGSLVMLLISVTMGERSLPFSMTQDAVQQNMTTRSLISMLVVGLVGVAHWGLSYIPYGVWAAIPIMLLIAWLLFRSYRRTDWGGITVV
ncbi:hypothetical protein FAES_0541 [Fibrella aestuarina BUZ 2]|uniref:ABC-2 type transport system permease protein n=1 Tax=Fibrella aestuarina BUZ 2 TaxID=1166018 RepID=I0K349_9BACT|nr:hypothetical protein [Fibrella aestuarina]CCG98552.1 hypothetical protein FAES_0541 [Fibrella aestuarina BUZ 2]